MLKNEHEVAIDCPTERVFDLVADYATWPRWHVSDEVKKTNKGGT